MFAKAKKSGNDYDRILKENFILELLDVFKVLLGIDQCKVEDGIELIASGKILSRLRNF